MKIVLFINNTKDHATQAIESICAWLDERGIDYETISGEFIGAEASRLAELRNTVQRADLLCTFGGDGTILRAAQLVGTSGVPLLCYNFGTLGFLTGARVDDLIPAMEAAVNGTLKLDARTMLEVTITYNDGCVDNRLAVNEIAVTRGHFGRIVALDMYINNSFIDTMRGDGLLVATPTGSTAYSLSAGGPLISPSSEGLCIVPISQHSLISRAIVTAKDDVVRLVPNELNRQQVVLFIDGEVLWITSADADVSSSSAVEHDAREVVSVEMRACAQKLVLARFGDYDYYERISKTFFRGGHA